MLVEIFSGTIAFTAIILALAIVIIFARRLIIPQGNVYVTINGDEKSKLTLSPGTKLLSALSEKGVYLSSACGGGGSCGECRCVVNSGGGSISPAEEPHFTRGEIKKGWRLSCQVAVKQDLQIEVDPSVFGTKTWECKVQSNNNVATFIKELVLALPPGDNVEFRAGGYVQLEAPPHTVHYKDFVIEKNFHEDWDKHKVWENTSRVEDATIRAYSMANYPEEKGILKFNIRIATPPPRTNFPPGKMSSYVFGLKEGDTMKVCGPFGHFFVQDTDAEMIYIGGGAGMAPLRSHIFDLFKRVKTKRKVSFWYGARSLRELFYNDEFVQLAKENPNFSWNVALSEPLPEDNWTGYVGFIHQVVLNEYLSKHPAPEDCEYYMCGPPVMNTSVKKMLDSLGVEPTSIFLDDFGG